MKRYMIPDEECLPRYFADEALPKLPPETITAMREAHRRDDFLYGTRLALQGREHQLLAALREVAELKAKLATTSAGFDEWFATQVEENDEDYPSPEEIGFARAAWSASKLATSTQLRELLIEVMTNIGALSLTRNPRGQELRKRVTAALAPTPPEATQ